MDNISILLHILFGGLTSGIAASFSPGKALGIWGYLIGAISGLIGGLLFLDVIRPNDIVGSVIAAMFTALLFIFVLRWAEEKGLNFDRFSIATNRSIDVPQLAELSQAKKSGTASFFNIFDEDVAHVNNAETTISSALNDQADISSLEANQKQLSYQNLDAPSDKSSNTSTAQIARGYDEDMFGQGVNSLQSPALFDTDDEVPNLETSSPQATVVNTASDKSRLDHALDLLNSNPDEPDDKSRFFDRLPFRNILRKASVNNHRGNSEAEIIYVPSLGAFPEDPPADEASPSDDSIFEHDGSGHIHHADKTETEAEEDIYREQYRFSETAVHNAEEPPAAAANDDPQQILSQEQRNIASTDQLESDSEQVVVETAPATPQDLEASEESYLMPSHNYPDDLTKIGGIDKVYAQRLHEMGIYTWIQVADTEPPLLRDWVAAENTANVEEWPQLARSLAIANDRLDASYEGPPPDDLTEITGITKIFEQRLNQMGIATFAQLAETETKSIIKGLAALNVVAAAVYDWQILAKQKIK